MYANLPSTVHMQSSTPRDMLSLEANRLKVKSVEVTLDVPVRPTTRHDQCQLVSTWRPQ